MLKFVEFLTRHARCDGGVMLGESPRTETATASPARSKAKKSQGRRFKKPTKAKVPPREKAKKSQGGGVPEAKESQQKPGKPRHLKFQCAGGWGERRPWRMIDFMERRGAFADHRMAGTDFGIARHAASRHSLGAAADGVTHAPHAG